MKHSSGQSFHGWWIAFAAAITFGISVGLPYYNIPFFYDYFQRAFAWSHAQITLGFPIAALLTIWFGPAILHRLNPRKLIVIGTGLTAISLAGFARMRSNLFVYYGLWFIYMLGYTCAGPVPHQLLISRWFWRNRGKAMGFLFAGVALFGSLGSFLVTSLTRSGGIGVALNALAFLMLITWPLAFFVLKDQPSDVGQHADGRIDSVVWLSPSLGLLQLVSRWPFWLLLIGSTLSIGAIGAINFHLKFVLLEGGYEAGLAADRAWRTASVLILWSSITGRLLMGALADRFTKKGVMAIDYLLVAATIPLLLAVRPGAHLSLPLFSALFGFGMRADYMLIPLVAAEQFGVNNLARVMSIIIPVTILGQSWFPYIVSLLRELSSSYRIPMTIVLGMSALGALAVILLPRGEEQRASRPELGLAVAINNQFAKE
jgi:MFS family permease